MQQAIKEGVRKVQLLKLIIESYREMWKENKLGFILTIFPIVATITAIVISILK